MLKLYLKSRLLEGSPNLEAKRGLPGMQGGRRRNRRLAQRYEAWQRHVTLLNDQDILVVKNLSHKGFSTHVSERAYERFMIGDVYESRIRIGAEIFDLNIKVIWKEEGAVGFEIAKASRTMRARLHSLIKPLEIAASLQPVDKKYLDEEKLNFRGVYSSDLRLWMDEDGTIKAWQLAVGEVCILWNSTQGMFTGRLVPKSDDQIMLEINQDLSWEIKKDSEINPASKQLALDVIYALDHPVRDALVESVGEHGV